MGLIVGTTTGLLGGGVVSPGPALQILFSDLMRTFSLAILAWIFDFADATFADLSFDFKAAMSSLNGVKIFVLFILIELPD